MRMYIVGPSLFPVNTIGLIGITDNAEVMEYYKILQESLQQKFPDNPPFDIAVYCLLPNEDNGNVLKLFNAVFKLMQNPVKTILICNHELEIFVPYINEKMIGISNILQSGTAVSKFFNNKNLSKILLFETVLSQPINFFNNVIAKDGVQLYALNKEERTAIDSFKNKCLSKTILSDPEFTEIKNKLNSLSKRGIHGILVHSSALKKVLNIFETDVPVLYTKEIHVEQGIERMFIQQDVQRAFNGLSHP